MKKILYLVLFNLIFTCFSVKAKTFYINDNGVEFSKEQYSFISKFYFEGYQDYMTKSDYQEFVDSNIINGNIAIQEAYDYGRYGLVPYSNSSHETASKILQLSTSCSKDCTVVVKAVWKKVPTTKTYDLIGAYFENTSLRGLELAQMYYGGNISSSIENTIKNNGLSSTFKLPNTNDLITIMQRYKVSKSGKLYVSYQHAKNSVSLAESRLYSFGPNGYGGVFNFDSSLRSKYDGMKGLNIYLK